eukprot:maker-scaffold1776_size28529-snap-gene-0.5 protein:Tk03117 transcript:maker-scaffold1776_size28529-snap-gene-0.5-mRNA-1 annotation:"hypothetical protein ACD_57C00400G0001"
MQALVITTTLLLVASALAQDGPYRYRYSPDMPNAPPFKFPENNPVPLPTSNTPDDGNTNYQYQYAPTDSVARPFQVPADYTTADFVYTYKPRPGDSFTYNYVPVAGEFDFVFTPVQSDLNATPEQILITTTLLLVASALAQDGPYRYRYSPDMPNAPPFKFPENNPVPLPTSNTPDDGNTNYQYQYAPTDS